MMSDTEHKKKSDLGSGFYFYLNVKTQEGGDVLDKIVNFSVLKKNDYYTNN